MSQLLVEPIKQTQEQLKPSKILRTTKLEQCYCDVHRKGRFCAMGVILNKLGWNPYSPLSEFERYWNLAKELVSDELIKVIVMNDDERTFDEIADYLESRGL